MKMFVRVVMFLNQHKVFTALAAVMGPIALFMASKADACAFIAGQTPIPEQLRK